MLEAHGVRFLIDVRYNAVSRKPGFAKSRLEAHCAGRGIGYVHLRELGCDSARRRAVRSGGDLERLFGEYRRELPGHRVELEAIGDLLERHRRVALTCFERDPLGCHRHIVADHLAAARGVMVEHL